MSVLSLSSTLTKTLTGASADLSHNYRLQLDVLEPWLCRVALVPQDDDFVANTWMIAPPDSTIDWQGRDRLSTAGYSTPQSTLMVDEGAQSIHVQSEQLCITVQQNPLAISVSRVHDGAHQRLLHDRPMAGYRVLSQRSLIQHAQLRNQDHLHLGLGDKAGTLDRTGKRFRILQTDALGYNAETSDPLYKHVPWIIVGDNTSGYCGIFYDSFAEMNVDLGAEHSNYHKHYRLVEAYERALVYYVIDGPGLVDVVTRFQTLVGKPHLQPRWALGFAHTSMHLADADNAQDAILDFVEQAQRKEIPLSAVHSGSGYTTRDDGRRYVFTWNTKKFPNKEAFFNKLDEAGLHSCANIKPVLLCEHPLFDEVAEFGGFIKDVEAKPAIEMFWGGPGASLDFTNPETIEWWKAGVTKQVLEAGFSSTWNDNNECEIWDEQATVHGFGKTLSAMDVRPVHALLMLRASFEATLAHEPDKRPYTISRAGPVGIARYAQTWSGDNRTSWHTLEWNMANGLSMSLSGLPFVGHDIGGFDGPKPDAELLCRWVEMMCLHPRAVMNSWKPDETDPATLPWMYPVVEDEIRAVLNLRYRYLPWLYHLSWCSHTTGIPSIAPLMLYFNDDACANEHTQFLLGKSILVAPVIERGATTRSVYLPKCLSGWYAYDAHTGDAQWYAGKQSITVEAGLGQLPVFVKAGAVLPIAKAWQADSPHEASDVCITVFIGQQEQGQLNESLFTDDGETWDYQEHNASLLNISVEWNASEVNVDVVETWSGKARPNLSVSVVGMRDQRLVANVPSTAS